jgi:hypothetical protein
VAYSFVSCCAWGLLQPDSSWYRDEGRSDVCQHGEISPPISYVAVFDPRAQAIVDSKLLLDPSEHDLKQSVSMRV